MDKNENNLRPPIVTIMGHVDHGKTTLLDVIRKTNVAGSEHGGITQHIGAYQITLDSQPITFIDTPGHAAFEKMRSRGAEVADIVILTVAANDGVKPQTTEAIKHIQRAQKPLIVAITKTDLPDINLDKVKKELQAQNVVIEQYGGKVPLVEVAAPKGKGIDELLEVINLVWQLSPQPSLPAHPLEAVVVESQLDKSRGPVVSVIVKKGTLRVSQKITVDDEPVTVRALIDDNGQNVKEAGPSKPVEILGFKKLLEVGTIVGDFTKTPLQAAKAPASYAEIVAKAEAAKGKFKAIIKADVSGSLEAIAANLPQKVLVIDSGIGEVTTSDVALGKIAHAPILAFNVKVQKQVKAQAESEGVVIKPYNIIYELLDDIEQVVLGFEEAKQELKISGRAKIVATFTIEGKKIAGLKVTHGKIKVGDKILFKHSGKIFETNIESLKKFKKNVVEASSGQECGVALNPAVDFQEGDIIESLG